MGKPFLKGLFSLLFLALAAPGAILSGFGRIHAIFVFFAQAFSRAPGLPGDYLRAGYYRMTLEGFGEGSRIQFGSYFAHSQARVGKRVYLGAYNILGRVEIGDGCQIASGVQILSGGHQHIRGDDGRISGAETGAFRTVCIGEGCWIGAGSIVMADVGENTTVGAGSVVTKALPGGCTAAGVPARVLNSRGADTATLA